MQCFHWITYQNTFIKYMNPSDSSSRVNNSIHFTFEQSGVKGATSTYSRRDTLDDLQYSVDEIPQSHFSKTLKSQQQSKMQNVPPPLIPNPALNNQIGKKRERKGIFQKTTPRNIGVVNNGIEEIHGKASSGAKQPQVVSMKRNQIFNQPKQPKQLIPPIQPNPAKMTPPPYLPRNAPTLNLQQTPATAVIAHNRNSNTSVASVVINEYDSLIINENNNLYAQERNSRQMGESFGVERYGSLQLEDISLIQEDMDLNLSQSSVRSMRSTLLDDMRLSGDNSRVRHNSGIMLSGVGIVESLNGNVLSPFLTIQANQQPVPVHIPTNNPTPAQSIHSSSPTISNVGSNQPPLQHSYIKQLNQSPPPSQILPQPHSMQPSFLRPNSIPANILVPQTHQNQILNDPDNFNHPSNLSIHSIQSDIDFKSSTNSSNLLDSESMNRALGKLSQYIFVEPVAESRIPQLLQECCRLNSVSINLLSPNLPLDSIRHKEMIRNQIFQSLLATQTLQKLRDEIQNRERKQKKILKSFSTHAFLQGEWYQINKIKNSHTIKINSPHTKRQVDYQIIKQTLNNSLDVLKYYQGFIEHFRIQPTQQFKHKYIQLRNSLFDIFNNLKKISQDLYMKSINNNLPELYFKMYQYLKPSSLIKSQGQVSSLTIQNKERIVQLIQEMRRESDPLASSDLGATVHTKIRNQLNNINSSSQPRK